MFCPKHSEICEDEMHLRTLALFFIQKVIGQLVITIGQSINLLIIQSHSHTHISLVQHILALIEYNLRQLHHH